MTLFCAVPSGLLFQALIAISTPLPLQRAAGCPLRRTHGGVLAEKAPSLRSAPMAPTAVDPDPTDHLLAPAPAPVAVAGGGVGGYGPLEVVINVSSSDTDSDSPGAGGGKRSRPVAGRGGGRDREEKKARILAAAATVPAGFLEPLPPPPVKLLPPPAPGRSVTKQFWKAGDYDGKPLGDGVAQPSGTILILKPFCILLLFH